MLRISSIILLLLMVGCAEQPEESKEVKKPRKSRFSGSHYELPPAPPPELPPPPEPKEDPLTDEFFPDDGDIEATQRASLRLGDIRHKLRIKRNIKVEKKEVKKEKTVYLFEDEDYRRIKVPANKSSYPVNRDRMLTVDMTISVILAEGINSQISGRLVAQVDRPVLSPTMKNILLPSGTKFVCIYEGLQKTGQTRLAINCKHLIRPDGSRVLLTSMTAGDMSGKQGVIGEIDNRYFQRYGGTFLTSAISALSQASSDRFSNTGISNTASAFSAEMGKLTSKNLEKYLDLRPIITVEAGTRITLKPMQDIAFIKPEVIIKPESTNETINNEEGKTNEDD